EQARAPARREPRDRDPVRQHAVAHRPRVWLLHPDHRVDPDQREHVAVLEPDPRAGRDRGRRVRARGRAHVCRHGSLVGRGAGADLPPLHVLPPPDLGLPRIPMAPTEQLPLTSTPPRGDEPTTAATPGKRPVSVTLVGYLAFAVGIYYIVGGALA